MSSIDTTKGREPKNEGLPATRTMTLIGITRTLIGTAVLFAPVTTCKLFYIPIAVSSGVPLAMAVGARDIALGGLLLTADTANKDKREVRRLLMAGTAADAIDVGITAFALARGQMSTMGAGAFGSGAALMMFLGLYALKSLQ